MDPELKALLDKYAAAGASDDEIRQVAAEWQRQRSSALPGLQGLQGLQDVSPALQQQVDARQAEITANAKPSLAKEALSLAKVVPGLSPVLGLPNQQDWTRLARQGVSLAAGTLPGSTAAGAYVASKMSGRPYGDVMRDVNAQMADMPAGEQAALNLIGGIPTAGVAGKLAGGVPAISRMANPVLRGAATGVASGVPLAAAYRAARPTPEPMGARVRGTASAGVAGGVIGGLAGAVAPMVAARRLAAAAPKADVAASDAAAGATATDQQNFGRVHGEIAAAGGTSPDVQRALDDPDLAPYVRDIEAMPATRNLSDAEKLLAARNLMTERQGQIIGPMDARHPGAGSTYENRSLGMMKGTVDRAMTDPASPVAPSLPQAEAESAQNARNRNAAEVVRKIARRELAGGKTPVNESKLVAQGDFNTGRMYQGFDPGQRQAAQQAILAQIKESPRFSKLPLIRLPFAPSQASRAAPGLLEKMGDTRPSAMADLLRNLVVAGTVPQFGNAP